MHQHDPTAHNHHQYFNYTLRIKLKAETLRCFAEMRDLEHASKVVIVEFATQILSPPILHPYLQAIASTTNYLIQHSSNFTPYMLLIVSQLSRHFEAVRVSLSCFITSGGVSSTYAFPSRIN